MSSPNQTILSIRHNEEPGDDRASRWLASHGYDVRWVAPYEGDRLKDIDHRAVAGTVIYGGPHCFDEPDVYPWLLDEADWALRCIDAGKPVLGFCLGAQVLAGALGADVGAPDHGFHEFGYYPVRSVGKDNVIPDGLVVTQAHFHGFRIPVGAEPLASSELFENQAFRYGGQAFGFQFHAEIDYAGFRRWQDADWADGYYGKPGAQNRAEQDRLAAAHDAAQDAWFTAFLAGVFETRPGGEG